MPPVDRAAIAAEVRAEVARRKYTQRDVADILGLPQPSVQLRLAGRRSFRAEELVALAEAFDVPLTRFVPSAVNRAAA